MPVFSVMRPQIQEQASGYGAGGGYDPYTPQRLSYGAMGSDLGGQPMPPMGPGQPGAIAPAGPVGTAPPNQGPGYPGGGAYNPVNGQSGANPFDPILDPEGAIIRAMRANHINPGVQTWGVQQLLKRAKDIVYQAVGRAVLGGGQDMLANTGSVQDMINSLIGGGGAVLSNPGEGRSALNAVSSLLAGAAGAPEGAPGGLGASTLLGLFGDNPTNANALTESLLYGSLANSVRQAGRASLIGFPSAFQQYSESNEGANALRTQSALSLLLNGGLPGWGGPAGAGPRPANAGLPLNLGQ